jgi:hypothetical protein
VTFLHDLGKWRTVTERVQVSVFIDLLEVGIARSMADPDAPGGAHDRV